MNGRLKRVLALAAISSLAACGGGGKAVPTAPQSMPGNPTAPYTGPQDLANFTWGAQTMQGATYAGPARMGTMAMNVQVQMQNEAGLLQYAQEASDPSSPVYRHFLTPQEIGDRFGASARDYTAVAQYFASFGLHVGGWPQREVLFVAGPQSAFEAAFGTKFGLYQKYGQTFVAPLNAPHFSHPVPVAAVRGLVGLHLMHTMDIPVRAGSNTYVGGYSPQQVQNAFDYAGAYLAGFTGTGITAGIIGTGPFSPKDVPLYGRLYHAQVATVTQVDATDSGEATGLAKSGIPTPNPNPSASPQPPYAYGDFGLASPPPVTASCSASNGGNPSEWPTASCNPEDGETQLDTEQIASLAPGATVHYYLAFNPTDCEGVNAGNCKNGVPNVIPAGAIGAQGLAIADDEIQQAIADDTADVISASFGGGEIDNVGFYFDSTGKGFGPMEFATLASEGIAVFVSSGDSGAEECQNPNTGAPIDTPCVDYPGGDPSVTSVGGVTAPLNTFGQVTGQITAWGFQTSSGFSGSGGGCSQIFAAPPWQAQNITNSPCPAKRQQPDLSLLADPATGVGVVMNAFSAGGTIGAVGGTSVAAPEMAAMWALVLQACSKTATCDTATGGPAYRLGNAAPLIYAIYGGKYAPGKGNPSAFTPQLPYSQVFYDVLYGTNAQAGASPPPPNGDAYQAGPGYDLVTGVGVPFAGHLIQAITGQKAN